MAASLSLTTSSRLLSPFHPPSKSLLHHAYFGDSVHAKPSLRGTLCVPLAGFKPGFESADLLIGELLTRAESLIYTVADVAVSSSDVVTSTTAGTKQNSDWLSGSQGWVFYLARAIRLRICNYSPKNKSPFQRTYAAQIKKCGEMTRKLRFFKDQMSKAGLTPSIKSVSPADISVDDLEIKLGELEAELVEMNSNNEKLGRSYNELVEYKLVLQKVGEYFHLAQSSAATRQREIEAQQTAESSLDTPLLQDQEMGTVASKQIKLGVLSGLVPREKSLAFERILFRATRGNIFLRQAEVE